MMKQILILLFLTCCCSAQNNYYRAVYNSICVKGSPPNPLLSPVNKGLEEHYVENTWAATMMDTDEFIMGENIATNEVIIAQQISSGFDPLVAPFRGPLHAAMVVAQSMTIPSSNIRTYLDLFRDAWAICRDRRSSGLIDSKPFEVSIVSSIPTIVSSLPDVHLVNGSMVSINGTVTIDNTSPMEVNVVSTVPIVISNDTLAISGTVSHSQLITADDQSKLEELKYMIASSYPFHNYPTFVQQMVDLYGWTFKDVEKYESVMKMMLELDFNNLPTTVKKTVVS